MAHVAHDAQGQVNLTPMPLTHPLLVGGNICRVQELLGQKGVATLPGCVVQMRGGW